MIVRAAPKGVNVGSNEKLTTWVGGEERGAFENGARVKSSRHGNVTFWVRARVQWGEISFGYEKHAFEDEKLIKFLIISWSF